eukprot:Plantae.Rhodophyta-Hildenbrandia_rubra.ctg15448.p1 GENE.Plantae.Rhodophyta-Hildenbrandia_rubra.ctg15448~~Plantae.Rhodophyta-Hildenbrandia_rubra.ctg15448.p1  ORF type:complete len:460 (+),score=111.65 Plantae.Rhodophyta-Hildenbrandia_rubra.ctg15448:3141-4520(+)
MGDTSSGAGSKSNESWGGWLSSVYTTVMGDGSQDDASSTNPQPGQEYGSIVPTMALHRSTTSNDVEEEAGGFGNVPEESRRRLWKQLANYIGMDVMNMRMSLPIWLFEPTTALVRMCEMFEFWKLLERAACVDDPFLRDCYVVAFIVSAFSHTERVKKPLNPCLGETFAYQGSGIRFVAEQVSHHPPIGVSYAEGDGWSAGETVDIVAMYQGNSIEVKNVGERFVKIKTKQGQELEYRWTLPTAGVSNLFIGGAFVDHYGKVEIKCSESTTVLNLAKCGWFSKGRYEVNGEMTRKESGDEVVAKFSGFWNRYLDVDKMKKRPGEGTNRVWMAGDHLLTDEEAEAASMINSTPWTRKILEAENDHGLYLSASDSRYRPDRKALQEGESSLAAEEKLRIEQMQRERIKKWKEMGKDFKPRWFKSIGKDENDKDQWEYGGKYWDTISSSNSGVEKLETLSLW